MLWGGGEGGGVSAFPEVFPRTIKILRVSRESEIGSGKHIQIQTRVLGAAGNFSVLIVNNPRAHKFLNVNCYNVEKPFPVAC